MFVFFDCVCPNCERLVDRQFVKALQAQGHSFQEVFAIILDMEFHVRSRREWVINQVIRQRTINGFFYFEKDESGDWRVMLTELGLQRDQDLDFS